MATKRKTPPKKKTAQKTGPTRLPNGQLVGGNPGNSGGKKGRSGRKPSRFKELCAQVYEDNKLLRVAVLIALDEEEKASDRLAAIRYISDNAYGRPAQGIELEGTIGVEDVTALRESLKAQLARVAERNEE